jgi:hypothetical protein
MVSQRARRAAIAPKQRHTDDIAGASRFERRENVGRGATRAKTDQHIAGMR